MNTSTLSLILKESNLHLCTCTPEFANQIVGVVYVCGGGSVVQGGEMETRNEETNEGYSAIFQSHSQVNVQINSVRSKLATVMLNHMWYGDDRK